MSVKQTIKDGAKRRINRLARVSAIFLSMGLVFAGNAEAAPTRNQSAISQASTAQQPQPLTNNPNVGDISHPCFLRTWMDAYCMACAFQGPVSWCGFYATPDKDCSHKDIRAFCKRLLD